LFLNSTFRTKSIASKTRFLTKSHRLTNDWNGVIILSVINKRYKKLVCYIVVLSLLSFHRHSRKYASTKYYTFFPSGRSKYWGKLNANIQPYPLSSERFFLPWFFSFPLFMILLCTSHFMICESIDFLFPNSSGKRV